MTVDENLRAIDVVVIVTMWTLQFLDSWLQTLFDHSAKVIYGDFMESESSTRYAIYLLFAKCALACVVAIMVDAYNHKYLVAIGGMALYIFTPVLALCMCISERKIFSKLTLAASSILFVTSPAAFGVIFNQKKSPVRIQIRRLVSIMEFTEGLLLVMIGVTIPEKAVHNERYSMVASWVVVIPFFIFILTILERIRKYVRPERPRERGIVSIFKGIQNEITGKELNMGLSKINVLFFVLLLLPAFSLTSLGSVVAHLKPANDTQFQHPLLKRIIKVGQLTVIPFTEVILSFVPLPEVFAEMFVLGIAHILNIIVLTLLVVRMTGESGSSRSGVSNNYKDFPSNHAMPYLFALPAESSSKFDDLNDRSLTSQLIRAVRDNPSLPPILPPDERRFDYFIINPTPIKMYLYDEPQYTLFHPSGDPPILFPEIGLVYNERNMTGKEETISIIARPNPAAPPYFTQTIRFKEKQIYFLIVTRDSKKLDLLIAGDDVEIPKIVLKPILIVQNTFVGGQFWGRQLEGDHELQVTTETGSTIFIDVLPERSKSLSLVVPAGNLTLNVSYQGSDPVIKEKLKTAASKTFDVKPSTFNVIYININTQTDKYVFSEIFLIFEEKKKPPTTTAAPPGPDKPDAVMQTTYAMFGISIGLTSVG